MTFSELKISNPMHSLAYDSNTSRTLGIFESSPTLRNGHEIDKLQIFMGIVTGCIAGILGLKDVAGLLFFFFLQTVVFMTTLIHMSYNLESFLDEHLCSFIFRTIRNSAMPFLLFWTLFYGLVHLF